MIWVGLLAVALFGLLPFLLRIGRPADAAGRREAEIALHRARLEELDRDLAEGRIGAAAHQAARTEIARRLLAADASAERPIRAGGRSHVMLLAALVPLGAGLAYLHGGAPGLPSMPVEQRRLRTEAEDALLQQLRARLAQMEPGSETARQGLLLLGGAELGRGNLHAAIESWRRALTIRFEARLAVDLAEAIAAAERAVTAEAVTLAQRALAAPGGLPPELRERAERISAGG